MNNTQAQAIENGFLLSTLFFERQYRLEKIQASRLLATPRNYSSEAIFNDNTEADLEMLRQFATPFFTPPVVTELHFKRCLDSGVVECTCSADKRTKEDEIPF